MPKILPDLNNPVVLVRIKFVLLYSTKNKKLSHLWIFEQQSGVLYSTFSVHMDLKADEMGEKSEIHLRLTHSVYSLCLSSLFKCPITTLAQLNCWISLFFEVTSRYRPVFSVRLCLGL